MLLRGIGVRRRKNGLSFRHARAEERVAVEIVVFRGRVEGELREIVL
jgi:hypothetical protein